MSNVANQRFLERLSEPLVALGQVLASSWAGPHLRHVAANWRTIALYALISGGAAAAVSLLLPSVYVSQASLVVDTPERTGLPASLAQFAGQLGVPGLESGKTPEFYRDLMQSRRVLTALLRSSIHDPRTGQAVPVYRVYGNEHDSLSPKRVEALLHKLGTRLESTVDVRTSVIRVALGAPTPAQASEALDTLLSLANEFAVTNLRSRGSARRQFAEAQATRARGDLTVAEDSLRRFEEQNRRVADSPTLQFEEARLRRRVELAQELYLTLDREFEQARIDEVRDTPVLNVIDPPVAPTQRDSPKRRALTLMAAFFGALAATAGLILQRIQTRG